MSYYIRCLVVAPILLIFGCAEANKTNQHKENDGNYIEVTTSGQTNRISVESSIARIKESDSAIDHSSGDAIAAETSEKDPDTSKSSLGGNQISLASESKKKCADIFHTELANVNYPQASALGKKDVLLIEASSAQLLADAKIIGGDSVPTIEGICLFLNNNSLTFDLSLSKIAVGKIAYVMNESQIDLRIHTDDKTLIGVFDPQSLGEGNKTTIAGAGSYSCPSGLAKVSDHEIACEP